jgi:hypothetical protein
MDGHVPDQVALVPIVSVARRTRVVLFRRFRRIHFQMGEVDVTPQQLALPEGGTAAVDFTRERLLVGVDENVRFEVTCRYRGVRAEVAFEALFAFVGLGVQLKMGNLMRNIIKYLRHLDFFPKIPTAVHVVMPFCGFVFVL